MLWQEIARYGRAMDPFREFQREFGRLQQECSELFSRRGAGRADGGTYPALNVWMDEEDATVQAEVPGIDPKDLEISVVGQTLTLRGARKPLELKEGESYHRRERTSGEFTRTVELPFRVDGDKVSASYSKGILEIRLPRAAQDRPTKIAVKAE
ncbi:MAG: Hsp20/alpha crystallin family protein [Planctomycetes bacterium]|nr:Hsp20/alpha crystallin family protein [Planctomycetota bacterium]